MKLPHAAEAPTSEIAANEDEETEFRSRLRDEGRRERIVPLLNFRSGIIRRRLAAAICLMGLWFGHVDSARAVNQTWVLNGIGDWDTPAHWSGNAVPDMSSLVTVPIGTAQITGIKSIHDLWLGTAGGAGDGAVVVMSSGSLTIATTTRIGQTGSGTLTIQSGAQVTNKNTVFTGLNSEVIVGGTWMSTTMYVEGSGTTGVTIQAGGLVSLAANPVVSAYIGNAATTFGKFDVAGTWTSLGQTGIGVRGTGTLTIRSGGLVQLTDSVVGWYAGSSGTQIVSGTSQNSGFLYVGLRGEGLLTIESGGEAIVNGLLWIGIQDGSVGTLNLNSGGRLDLGGGADGLRTGTGTSQVNFAGGTLRVINTDLTSSINAALSGITAMDTNGLNATFSGVFTGAGGLNKLGTGTMNLSGANAYQGGTTITAGTLETANLVALGTGAVSLAGGSLAPVAPLTIGSLDWSDGSIVSVLGTTMNTVTILGDFTLGVEGGTFAFSPGAGFATGTTYDLLNAPDLASVNLAGFSGNALSGLAPTFTRDGITLQVSFAGQNGGPILQNSGPVFTPTNADFPVDGRVVTGTPAESNLVNSLIFAEGSSLEVFNNLTVTSGILTVRSGSASITGGTVMTPGNFTLNGSGTLTSNSNFQIGGSATISKAKFVINSLFQTAGNLNVNDALIVNGTAEIGGSLVANSGLVTVNGVLDIDGAANLDGSTRLRVNRSGSMTATGGTQINAGSRAIINGQLTSPQVRVSAGARLHGTGLITGNVFNRGVVAPGNSPGTLTIQGNFTQGGSGTLQIEVANATVFDRLIVSGNASLAGSLKVLSFGGHRFEYGQRFAVLQADNIRGNFDSIRTSSPSRFRARFLTDGGTGTILIAPASYTLLAETRNQKNVAGALDQFVAATRGDRETVSVALDAQSAREYPAAFDAIAPGFYEGLANITIEQTNAQNQIVAQRLSAIRSGARGFLATGLQDSSDSSKGVKDIISPAPDNQWGGWAQASGSLSKVNNLSQTPDYHYETGGFLTGVDKQWSEHFTSGVFLGYQFTDLKSHGYVAESEGALLGVYATYQAGGFYGDAILTGGYNDYEVKRPIKFSTIERTALSEPDGGHGSAYLGSGYDWKVDRFTFGPILSGQYAYAGIDPLTEHGAESLDLRLSRQHAYSLRSSLGARLAYTWDLTENLTITPEARVSWQHEYLDDSRTIGANLDGGRGPGFQYETASPDRDSAYAAAGVSAQLGERWNATVFYNADFGREDFSSHMLSVGFEWKF